MEREKNRKAHGIFVQFMVVHQLFKYVAREHNIGDEDRHEHGTRCL